MFNGQKYMTNGISNKIPMATQLIMWTMVENLKTKISSLDYLQVFELTIKFDSEGKPEQHIKHFQECPPHKTEFTLKSDMPVEEKIYIIDDKTHVTMLLASEY